MDILDILLDILLKPPQPLMGLFFNFQRSEDDEKRMGGEEEGQEAGAEGGVEVDEEQ